MLVLKVQVIFIFYLNLIHLNKKFIIYHIVVLVFFVFVFVKKTDTMYCGYVWDFAGKIFLKMAMPIESHVNMGNRFYRG